MGGVAGQHDITVIKQGGQYWAECPPLSCTVDSGPMPAAQTLLAMMQVDLHQACHFFLTDKTHESCWENGPWHYRAHELCGKCKKREFDNAIGCACPTVNTDKPGDWTCNRYHIQKVTP